MRKEREDSHDNDCPCSTKCWLCLLAQQERESERGAKSERERKRGLLEEGWSVTGGY